MFVITWSLVDWALKIKYMYLSILFFIDSVQRLKVFIITCSVVVWALKIKLILLLLLLIIIIIIIIIIINHFRRFCAEANGACYNLLRG